MAQDVAILDIGSQTLTVLTGRRGINNTIVISGRGQCDYAGYRNGEWFEPEKLFEAIGQAISMAEDASNFDFSEVYVGVPSDFSTVICKDVGISFPRKRKITRDDIDMLHEQGNSFENDPDYALIHSQPIYYTLDDDRRLIDPEGMPSQKLGGCISYILAEKRFLDSINLALDTLGIEKAEFVSGLLAEALYLFDDVKRDQYAILIDVDAIASSVALVRGDGLLCQYSFSLGGSHITGDLAMKLGISYSQATSLKNRVILSLEPSDEDIYQITGASSEVSFKASIVNDIVIENLAKLASAIQKCLKLCKYSYPDHIPYHISGVGLAGIHGAKDILSNMLDRPIEIVAPKQPQFGKPELSRMLGTLDLVILNQEDEKPTGFVKKLLAYFGRG